MLRGALTCAAVLAVAVPATAGGTPVVWVQAGHLAPGEPGYRAQTGTAGGPFGSEVRFTTRLRAAVVARLRRAGVEARPLPALVTPLGGRGATFISLHHDAPGGQAAIGHAIAGAGENWYRGEGFGDPSPTPYPDSAPHRRPTTVTPAVESRSRALARRIGARLRAVYTPANGARAGFAGVVPRDGNVRMMRFYGYYRTGADARVLVECGAAGSDDAFLARVDLIAGALTGALTADLRARGLLPPAAG